MRLRNRLGPLALALAGACALGAGSPVAAGGDGDREGTTVLRIDVSDDCPKAHPRAARG